MKNRMTRICAGALALLLLFALASCQKQEETDQSLGTPLDGGWSAAESAELTEDQLAVFGKALEGLTGVDYVPVAYLGSQVVAGWNHCFLCRATTVVPGAQPTYKLVYVYEDPDGKAEISNIVDLLGDGSELLPGGWQISEDAAMTEDVQAAFDKATEALVGVNYEPVAVLGSQVVAGMNYKVLCKATAVTPGAQPGYAIVTLYNALDGSAEVLEITDVAW